MLIQEGLLFAFTGLSKNITSLQMFSKHSQSLRVLMMLTVTNITLHTCNINLVLIIGDVAPGFKPRITYKILSQNCSKTFTNV